MNLKKILSSVLVIVMLASISMSVYASDTEKNIFDDTSKLLNEDINNWNELAVKVGVPAEDLKESYGNVDRNTFLTSIQELSSLMDIYGKDTANYDISPYNVSIPGPPMNISDWRNLKRNLSNGSILISQHSYTVGFQHGHAAMVSGVYNESASDPLDKTIYFTEHPGAGYYSWRTELHNNPGLWWRGQYGIASYNVQYSDAMYKAGNEASKPYLLNKPYDVFGFKGVTSSFNCASIVWTAYSQSSGLDIGSTSASVLPYHLVSSPYTYLTYRYGNYSW